MSLFFSIMSKISKDVDNEIDLKDMKSHWMLEKLSPNI